MLTCDWPTRIIHVPRADLALVSGSYYTLDVVEWFRLLRELAGGEEGIAQSADAGGLCYRNTSPTVGTPRIVDVVNGYTVEFEDGLYSADFINGNTNYRDVEVKNQVSVGTNNVSGFSTIQVGSGLDAGQSTQLDEVHRAHFNPRTWNKGADTMTIFAADGVTPLHVFDTNDDASDIRPQ